MKAFFVHLVFLSTSCFLVLSARVRTSALLFGEHSPAQDQYFEAHAVHSGGESSTPGQVSHTVEQSDHFAGTPNLSALLVAHRRFSDKIGKFMRQLHQFQELDPSILGEQISLGDIVSGSLQSWLGKIDTNAQVESSCLEIPSDAVCVRLIRTKCSEDELEDDRPLMPPMLSRMPYDALTNELGVSRDWERNFKADSDLQCVMNYFQGPAVGMVKAGFTGFLNVLLEQSQWVTWAGPLASTNPSFRSMAAGPHGPLYMLLKETNAVRNVSNKVGSSMVLIPSDWYMALMPTTFVEKLVYVLDVAITLGLMRPGTHLTEEEGMLSNCHQLNHPALSDRRPAAALRICSYKKYATELRIKDLERKGYFEVIDDVRITRTSELESEDLGIMKSGQQIHVYEVVHIEANDPHIRGCIGVEGVGGCSRWISLMAPLRPHMWVERREAEHPEAEDDF